MGCDCGCGGTCPMCAPRLAGERFGHAYEILQTAGPKQASEKPMEEAKEFFKKVYPVEKRGEEYVILGKLGSDFKPKFLAKNPKDGGLFLLLGDHGSYSLLKGNEQTGLRFCQTIRAQLFSDCFALIFKQDGKFGTITDPDSPERQKPTYDAMIIKKRLVDLEIVPFQIVET